jgi:hypothetical protein
VREQAVSEADGLAECRIGVVARQAEQLREGGGLRIERFPRGDSRLPLFGFHSSLLMICQKRTAEL